MSIGGIDFRRFKYSKFLAIVQNINGIVSAQLGAAFNQNILGAQRMNFNGCFLHRLHRLNTHAAQLTGFKYIRRNHRSLRSQHLADGYSCFRMQHFIGSFANHHRVNDNIFHRIFIQFSSY